MTICKQYTLMQHFITRIKLDFKLNFFKIFKMASEVDDFKGLSNILKANENVVSNKFFSVSPGCLKFPHDNSSLHVQNLTVYNKTKRFLGFRVEESRSQYFFVFYEKYGIYPGSEETIIVKCKPFDQKMCFDAIRIHVTNEVGDVITIPLELFPSASWFDLPKSIYMPKCQLGKSVTRHINFPMPKEGEPPYFYYVSGHKPEVLTVSPTDGQVGMSGGTDRLTLIYHPREYTSLVFDLSIRFPGIEFHPYIVRVYMKCTPGTPEDYATAKETDSGGTTLAKRPKKPIIVFPSSKIRKEDEDEVIPPPDVFTPAGIMKFLLKRGGKTNLATLVKGPTGLTPAQEQRIYKQKEKEFHDRFNKVGIQQKSILLQHTRNISGQDSIEQTHELLMEIKRETERANREYQKALGMRDNDMEDLSRIKLKILRQRPVRDAAYDYHSIKLAPPTPAKFADPLDPGGKRWARRLILRKFIQAVLVVITRRRADKRIAKLKIMIRDVSKFRQKAASVAAAAVSARKLEPEEEEVVQKALEMINLGKQAEDEMEAEPIKEEMTTTRRISIGSEVLQRKSVLPDESQRRRSSLKKEESLGMAEKENKAKVDNIRKISEQEEDGEAQVVSSIQMKRGSIDSSTKGGRQFSTVVGDDIGP